MVTNTVDPPPKPKLTAAERKARWLSRQVFPCAVYVKNKYGDTIYLAQDADELTRVAMDVLLSNYDNGYYGDESWYATGTFEEFAVKELTMPLETATAVMALIAAAPTTELDAFKSRYNGLKRRYNDQQVALDELRNIKRIINGDADPFYAIGTLLNRSNHQYEMFEIRQFDKPQGN